MQTIQVLMACKHGFSIVAQHDMAFHKLAGTFVRLAMDQLLWAPFFLSTIVAAQFTLEVGR